MFERTVSFWKRLLGRQSPAAAAVAVQPAQDERRVWLRFPSDLETTVLPAGGGDPVRLTARLRNISLGGISLRVDRPFEPGDLLSVELPGATEQSFCTALACVVHASQGAEEGWILGCTFARELGEEDLAAFGVRRERHQPSDQRTWVRFACAMKASYQAIAGADTAPRPAQVVNLSASGVGLVVGEPVENGTLLSVELQAADGLCTRTMLSCVVHVTARAAGAWALGCNFIRSLSDEDLKALL
jgi:hypothetical protein